MLKNDVIRAVVSKDKRGRPVLSAQEWGREDKEREAGLHAGTRLFCASSLLKRILTKYDKDLLVLIKLTRYETESFRSDSRYTHTVGVARITKTCDLDDFKGSINHVHKMRVVTRDPCVSAVNPTPVLCQNSDFLK